MLRRERWYVKPHDEGVGWLSEGRYVTGNQGLCSVSLSAARLHSGESCTTSASAISSATAPGAESLVSGDRHGPGIGYYWRSCFVRGPDIKRRRGPSHREYGSAERVALCDRHGNRGRGSERRRRAEGQLYVYRH